MEIRTTQMIINVCAKGICIKGVTLSDSYNKVSFIKWIAYKILGSKNVLPTKIEYINTPEPIIMIKKSKVSITKNQG